MLYRNMLKKIFRKNGIIIINNNNSIDYNYFLINNYNELKDIEKIKIKYFEKKGYTYDFTL